MNDRDLQAMYERLTPRTAPDREDCLAPELVMRLASGDVPEVERLAGLEHIGACRMCRADFDLAAAVVEAGAALQRASRPTPWLALAASLVLVAGGVTLWRAAKPGGDVPRGGTDHVVLVAPIGTVTATKAERLVWRAVAEATYEVEILDADGDIAFATTTADTATLVPGSTLAAGQEYHWRVIAVLPDGRRRASVAQPLGIKRP